MATLDFYWSVPSARSNNAQNLNTHGGWGAPCNQTTCLRARAHAEGSPRDIVFSTEQSAVKSDPWGSELALGHVPLRSVWVVVLLSWGRDVSVGMKQRPAFCVESPLWAGSNQALGWQENVTKALAQAKGGGKTAAQGHLGDKFSST